MFDMNTAVRIAKIHMKRGAPAKTMANEAMAVTRPKYPSA
jgi:hypothetical protein